ncbi:MAG TPA: succinate dehydrogenase, hydrophobic membrane anchor protein [Steroidobacteraceae bacterium]|jgi:succinate dehydrogenase / fumarate reductase membrane anchor subunit|nr:succinate dehydrogenase, hydrophobic membrane anchor protein [Steroidobacteraceae bacterium]
MSLRSPIGRVTGLGTAKEGAGHWWSQRVTSVALLLLGLWFVASLLRMPNFGYELVTTWIAMPLNAVLLLLLIGTLVYHSQLGVQVVVEDYVHHHGLKIATMLLLTFAHVVVAALAIFAVLRIAFGGGA